MTTPGEDGARESQRDRHSIPEADPYYESGYHSTHHRQLIDDDEYFWARARVAAEFYFRPEERSARIFEYGCGVGNSMAALPHAGGWDISSEARVACRARNLNVYDDIRDVPRQHWNIVFCRHVLEHLEEPLAALRVMRELLAPDGLLYLVLPREPHARASFEPDVNQHLYCWTFRTLNNLVHRAGFRPIANELRYPLGWRALLPVRRVLGHEIYFKLTNLGGFARRNGELLLRAKRMDL